MPPRLKSPSPLKHFIREWRLHRRMTLDQLARHIGGTKGHLSSIETGKSTLMPGPAEAIAAVLGIDSQTLIARPPDAGVDQEQDLLALFRGATLEQRDVILEMARTVARMRRRPEG